MAKYKHAALAQYIDDSCGKLPEDMYKFCSSSDPMLLKEIAKLLNKQIEIKQQECMQIEALCAEITAGAYKAQRPQRFSQELIKMGNNPTSYDIRQFPIVTVEAELKNLAVELAEKSKIWDKKAELLQVIDVVQKKEKSPKTWCCGLFKKEKDKTAGPGICKTMKNTC